MRSILLALGLAGLFLGWNAPNHYPPWTAFHMEMFAAIGLCFISAAVLAVDSRLGRGSTLHATPNTPDKAWLRAAPSVRVWVMLAALPLLQWLSGQLSFRGDAIIGALYALGVAIALYVGQLWSAQRGSQQVLRTLFLTLTAAAVVACGLATAQWLHVPVPSWMAMELIDDRPFANFAQPNHLGLSMAMGVVAVAALFELGVLQRRWVYHLATAFLAWGTAISGSRASALALAAVALVWLLTRHRVRSRLHPRDLVLALVLGLSLFAAQETLHQWLHFRPSELRSTAEVGPRQWIWLHFWSAIQQRPWAGFGFNQAVEALASVSGQVHPSRNAVFAHNLVLDLMTWVGIPLALAMMAALIYWMASWLRKLDDRELMTQRHWVLAIWLALLLQSMLEFPFAHAYFLLPAALLAGAATPLPGALHGLKPGVRLGASPWMQGWQRALSPSLSCWSGSTSTWNPTFDSTASNAPTSQPKSAMRRCKRLGAGPTRGADTSAHIRLRLTCQQTSWSNCAGSRGGSHPVHPTRLRQGPGPQRPPRRCRAGTGDHSKRVPPNRLRSDRQVLATLVDVAIPARPAGAHRRTEPHS